MNAIIKTLLEECREVDSFNDVLSQVRPAKGLERFSEVYTKDAVEKMYRFIIVRLREEYNKFNEILEIILSEQRKESNLINSVFEISNENNLMFNDLFSNGLVTLTDAEHESLLKTIELYKTELNRATGEVEKLLKQIKRYDAVIKENLYTEHKLIKENEKYKMEIERLKEKCGEVNTDIKETTGQTTTKKNFNDVTIREIRKRRAKGEKVKDLAEYYDISGASICNIANKKTYKNVSDA